jgi:hypothetical protein
MGIFQKVPKKYLVGNNWANGFKTHNELTMYPLGKYSLAPSDYRPFAALDAGVTTSPFLLRADHQFLWRSELTNSMLATVYFSISPSFYFPTPRVHLTTNVHTY